MFLLPPGLRRRTSALDQLVDVALRGRDRAVADRGPFPCRQLALESIEEPVEHLLLPFGEGLPGAALPEVGLAQHVGAYRFGPGDRARKAGEEPDQPAGHVEPAFLRAFEHPVIVGSFLANLARHAVEALSRILRLRQRLIGDRARDAAVAVLERVDRHEPEMREARAQQAFGFAPAVEPIQERLHLGVEPPGRRCLIVHPLAADRPRNDLHRPTRVVAPRTGPDLAHARIAGREQRRLPAEQPLGRQQCLAVPRGVERHFHHAFGPPVGRRDGGVGNAEAARDRRSHAAAVEDLAFDLRALDDVFRERFKLRLELQVEAEPRHAPEEPALRQARGGERLKEPPFVPGQVGPSRPLPDVHNSPRLVRRIMPYSRRSASEFSPPRLHRAFSVHGPTPAPGPAEISARCRCRRR